MKTTLNRSLTGLLAAALLMTGIACARNNESSNDLIAGQDTVQKRNVTQRDSVLRKKRESGHQPDRSRRDTTQPSPARKDTATHKPYRKESDSDPVIRGNHSGPPDSLK